MVDREQNQRHTRRTLLARTTILAAGAGIGGSAAWGYATARADQTGQGFDMVTVEVDAGRLRGADGEWLRTFGFPDGWRVLPGDIVFVGPDPDDGADPEIIYAQPRVRWEVARLEAGESVSVGSLLGANDEFAIVAATDIDPELGYLARDPAATPVPLHVGISDGVSAPRPILAVRAA
jgi:hypothetical protein